MIAIDPEIKELQLAIYAKDQPEYLPLPVRKDVDGRVITCWKFSLRERLQLLFRGKLYLSVLTFHRLLQPIKLDLEKPR